MQKELPGLEPENPEETSGPELSVENKIDILAIMLDRIMWKLGIHPDHPNQDPEDTHLC